jgi:hypothetical protein
MRDTAFPHRIATTRLQVQNHFATLAHPQVRGAKIYFESFITSHFPNKNMSAEASLTFMGWSEAQARQALAATGGNIEAAIDWSASMCPAMFFFIPRVYKLNRLFRVSTNASSLLISTTQVG